MTDKNKDGASTLHAQDHTPDLSEGIGVSDDFDRSGLPKMRVGSVAAAFGQSQLAKDSCVVRIGLKPFDEEGDVEESVLMVTYAMWRNMMDVVEQAVIKHNALVATGEVISEVAAKSFAQAVEAINKGGDGSVDAEIKGGKSE